MISKRTIKKRIKNGMTPEQAATLPLQWGRKLTKEKSARNGSKRIKHYIKRVFA